jgi:hypothetical protein
MDGSEAIRRREKSSGATDCERTTRLKERLERLLREAADVEVELSRADGSIQGVPHYSLIEGRAHELGKQLSREVQQRQMTELAVSQASTAKCPDCGTWCHVGVKQRTVNSVDGTTALQEPVCDCPQCRKSFFPTARALGS